MFEVYYAAPADAGREKAVEERATVHGGKLTYREEESAKITLTIEFERREQAEAAARDLLTTGVHVEGPCDY